MQHILGISVDEVECYPTSVVFDVGIDYEEFDWAINELGYAKIHYGENGGSCFAFKVHAPTFAQEYGKEYDDMVFTMGTREEFIQQYMTPNRFLAIVSLIYQKKIHGKKTK